MNLLSDCGKYIAIETIYNGVPNFDVIAVDGSCIWLWGRYQPKGWDDDDPRYRYPEFSHMVHSISNNSWENRNQRTIPDYEIGFADVDMTKRIKPLTGNAIIKEYKARFRTPVKKLAWKYKPKKQ